MGLNEKRVSVTPGMARVLRRHETKYSCGECDMVIPRYPGRYPSSCPSCGGKLNDTSRASEKKKNEAAVAIPPVQLQGAKQKIMAAASAALGVRIVSVSVGHHFHGMYLVARDSVGRSYVSMEDDAPHESDPDAWLVHLASGGAFAVNKAASWVAESLPVVAVSMVPRLQALIEAGHRWTEPPTNHDPAAESVPVTCNFDLVEKMMPGGVEGLSLFLEGPVGEKPRRFYRVERKNDPVLVFTVSEDTRSVVVQATTLPEKWIGFDPRAEIVDEAVDEAEILDSLTSPTRKSVMAPRGGAGSGATRAHGGFRFEIGRNRKRKPMKDVARAVQNKRASRRGLAGRVRAAKAFHRSLAGQGMHKDLGRYNRGNHRGEAVALWSALVEAVATLPQSFGIPREEMPQIEGDQVKAFLDYLRDNGIDVELTCVPCGSLRGTQANIDIDKTAKMMGDLVDADEDHPLRDPVISSSDGYILDGHHRWAAQLLLDDGEEIDTYRIGLPIVELVRLAREFDGATYKKVGEAIVNEGDIPGAGVTGDRAVDTMPTATPSTPNTQEYRTVDQIFDGMLRKLIVLESTDVLEDVEFTEDGSIYLFFDPTLSRAEMEEIIRALVSAEPKLALIASPDKSLPNETAESDWWVAFLPSETVQNMQPDSTVYARVPGAPGQTAPKQQMVVQATTTLDAIAASVDVRAAIQAAGTNTENAQ